MRYTGNNKQIVCKWYKYLGADSYLINEAKKQLAIQLVDKLPFKVEETDDTPSGTEYTISLDVVIEDYKEFVKKYLQNQNENRTINGTPLYIENNKGNIYI